MTKLKKSVIACVSVAAALLVAFSVVLTVFSVKKHADVAAWQKVEYAAVSRIGELGVSYYDYSSRKSITIDGQTVDVERGKLEGDNRGHFVRGDSDYYIIILFDDGAPTGFLYSDGEEPRFIEKLNFVAVGR